MYDAIECHHISCDKVYKTEIQREFKLNMLLKHLKTYLLDNSLIRGERTSIVPLTGGVSSKIYLVKDSGREFVVKKALSKLNVKDDWYADVSRNKTEQDFINYVDRLLPGVVPKIIFSDPGEGLFLMEYFGADFATWKTQLLENVVNVHSTREAAQILGTIHRSSWGEPIAKKTFNTTKNFHQLRLEPYLLYTAKKFAELQHLFHNESDRLSNTHQCLVHGDFSPKNILIRKDRMVLLDCEVAWYGDPAFDVAFFMNHFLLKSLHFTPDHTPFIQNIVIFNDQYRRSVDEYYELHQLEQRISHLLPMLLLARVDGKSPVEYLTSEPKKNLIRKFVKECLLGEINDLDNLLISWTNALDNFLKQYFVKF
jgi:aminoglycoside phosphotransferase (APT) family kinase protein